MPNVIAGVLIGAAYTGVASRLATRADKLGARAKAYLVEFGATSLTGLPTACVVYLVRIVFT